MESKYNILEKRKKMAALIAAGRVKKNISQRELAALSGCSKSTIARIEGSVFSPNADQLYAILEALGEKIKVGGVVI